MSDVVEKGLTQGLNDITGMQLGKPSKRGIQIYTVSQLIGLSARDKSGDIYSSTYDNPYFFLSPEDRMRIAQLCTPVLGVVTSRMNRIAGTRWVITADKKNEDKIAEEFKSYYQIYREYQKTNQIEYIIARARILAELKTRLPEILPDGSNFNNCLLRWKRRIQSAQIDRADEITEWFLQPNAAENWEAFIKKSVFDYHIHGVDAIQKEVINGKLENLYHLPGGTVIPVRGMYTTSETAYLQVIDSMEPQRFFPDELVYIQNIPISSRSYPLVPIEALINKVAETLFFDKLMADSADGTRIPEKMIIVSDASPFGNVDGDLSPVPINSDEQKRIEEKLNTPLKGGVMTFSGNNATVVDLSRENTMSAQMQRQKDIREEVAMCFNMSNMEMNLTGSENTSGRSTSESQQEIDQGKGIVPILKTYQRYFTRDIIPFRFGTGYSLEFEMQKNNKEEIELQNMKVAGGIYSVNEIRQDELNLDPFDKEEYDYPSGASTPDGTANNPLFTRGEK